MAQDLFAEEQAPRELAAAEIAHAGITTDELLARAYERLAGSLAEHEKLIAALEKRRRELLKDFEALRVIAPRMRPHG